MMSVIFSRAMLKNQTKLDLFEAQRKVFDEALGVPSNSKTLEWKLLIMDDINLLILQTLYTVKDLREKFITLQIKITQEKSRLPGVTAVYLVEPTPQNIDIILRDAKKDLYSSVEIHFSSEPGADVIPLMAKTMATESPKSVCRVRKIDFSNMSFHPIDTNIAIVPSENQLASLIANLEYPPVFIYQKEQKKLVNIVRQKVSSYRNSPSKQNHQFCTAVLVVTREGDPEPVLLHDSNLSSLMIDSCSIRGMNVLQFGENAVSLDSRNEFWMSNKDTMISDAWKELVEQIGELKTKNKNKEALARMSKSDQKRSLVSEKDLGKDSDEASVMANHDIVAGVMSSVIGRKLPQFCDIEGELLRSKVLSSDQKGLALELLRDPKVSASDKIRFMIIYMGNSDSLSSLVQLEASIDNIPKPKIYTDFRNTFKPVTKPGGNFGFLRDKVIGTFGVLVNEAKNIKEAFGSNHGKGSSKVFSVTSLALMVADKGIRGVREEGKMQVAESKSGTKVKNILIYVLGGIDFKEYHNLSRLNLDFIYSGDRLAQAEDLLQMK